MAPQVGPKLLGEREPACSATTVSNDPAVEAGVATSTHFRLK